MNSELSRDRFDIGANWFKFALINKIESLYKEPDCLRKDGCIHELALNDYICASCIKWSTIQELLQIVKGIK